jgi:hypothetical protein
MGRMVYISLEHYELAFWGTRSKLEVDFIENSPRSSIAFLYTGRE